MAAVKLVECPRDAMQGLHDFIPTATKAAYLNTLLQVGFDTLDFGSFVSPKAIPQLRDTADVLAGLDLSTTKTKLLAIIANQKGAEQALTYPEIKYLGYPLSVSEEFQHRNTNRSIAEALQDIAVIQNRCSALGKVLVVYLSMGFGNPYGEEWSPEMVGKMAEQLHQSGVRIMALSDTIGVSNPGNISELFTHLIANYPNVEFGAHLHSSPNTSLEKVTAAYKAGCRRFDGALKGFGGCPMAKDELVGNMATELMVGYFRENGVDLGLDYLKLPEALAQAGQVFSAP
jgi:hydroxymethylglutaryl-CoA lyase